MWSSHTYELEAIELGRPRETIDASIEQIENLNETNPPAPAILTLNHLAKRTGVGYEWLRAFVMRQLMPGMDGDARPYRKFSIRKRSGGYRTIHIPEPKLMHTQRWINYHILREVSPHSASQAFTNGCSIKKCAIKHCGAQWMIKIDLEDFFGSVTEIQVYRVFRSLGYQALVSFELARLCTITPGDRSLRSRHPHWRVWKPNKEIPTYSKKYLGFLPQGAPTSPRLANLVMRRCDQEIQKLAKSYGLTFTRYSDDLCFSTRTKKFNRHAASKFIGEAYMVLAKYGYQPNLRKTSVVPPGAKKVVLGLTVDGQEPKISKEVRDKIRQHLYYLAKVGAAEHAHRRGFDSVWGLKCHLRGLIDFAHMIDEDLAQSYIKKFNEVDWPV
ncbi:reverse transcriptase family protein [Mameliella alba]|nr:reverse transcriptase family protein [Antarctobacter heliothermus]MBY6145244.1 reverse transcriptase family protein [Mameliella alba]MCA0954992.1 reverse transcriptase family protein [Mameliella alba]